MCRAKCSLLRPSGSTLPATLHLARYMRCRGPLLSAVILFLILVISLAATAQERSGLELYLDSVKQSDVMRQIAGLESFLRDNPSSVLRRDALAIAAWDYVRVSDRPRATDRARQLWLLDNNDPVAAAVLLDNNAFPETAPALRSKEIRSAIETPVRRPEGLREIDFAIMKQYVWRSLTGSAGLTYLDLRDYSAAASFLQQVVAADPDDPRYVFGLGNALNHLKGRDAEAFWYLARAVNLSAFSPQGQEIASYAREQYRRAGGNDRDWQSFLVAAAAPRESIAPVVEARKSGPPVPNAPQPEVASNAKSKNSKSKGGKRQELEAASVAKNRGPRVVDIPEPGQKPRPPLNNPVSLGILIQTAQLTPEYRKSIVFALSDMVRHLRKGDEAFILAFSNQMDFVQDLTDNDLLLQDALDHLKPAKGGALFDAVAFAAGHLKRIAKNENRVLLVVSDGTSSQGQASSFDVSAQLNQVRINCIGINVSSEAQRSLLRNLAQYSGGMTQFIETAPEFRTSTREMAQQIGIEFPR